MTILATPNGDETVGLLARSRTANFGYSPTDTFTGREVTPGAAMGIAAFYSGANLIAKTAGTLPLRVYERSGDTSRPVDPTKAQIALRLRHSPNPDVSAHAFWTTVFLHLVVQGNAYIAKVYEQGEFAPHLYIIPPHTVTPYRDANGDKLYRVMSPNGAQFTLTGRTLLHIPGISLGDGLVGHSPVSVLRHRLSVSLAASEHQQRFFRDGARLSGVLSVDGTLTQEAAQTIRDQWHSTYGGNDNAFKTAVLDHGAKYESISMSNEDAQFIEMMKLGATEIASMLNLPPAMIGAEGASLTYENALNNDMHFLKFSLRPWVRYVEAGLNNDADLFGPASKWEPEFDIDDLIRPDIATRYKVYETARKIGVLGVNEIRHDERRPPLDPNAFDDPLIKPVASSPTPKPEKPDAQDA